MYKFKKYRETPKYIIYNITNSNNQPIKFFINETNTPFGIEKFYSKRIVKWDITNKLDLLYNLNEFETLLLKHAHSVYSTDCVLYTKIIDRNSFGKLLETDVNKDSFDLIKHETGEVIVYSDIDKNTNVNIEIEIKSFNISKEENTIYYNISINKIYIL